MRHGVGQCPLLPAAFFISMAGLGGSGGMLAGTLCRMCGSYTANVNGGLFDGVEGYETDNFRYFLLDVQAHYSSVNDVPLDAELVQGGQLLMMKAPR